jgi:hypothetical protein
MPWKNVKSGGSDPTFSALSRPSGAWGRSRPAPRVTWRCFFHGIGNQSEPHNKERPKCRSLREHRRS